MTILWTLDRRTPRFSDSDVALHYVHLESGLKLAFPGLQRSCDRICGFTSRHLDRNYK